MKFNKSIVVMLFSLIFSALISVTASYAWFISLAKITSEDLSGSVFQNYFHCGTGNEDDPFVITRPKHWENLVYLHNNIEGFYDAEAYKHSTDEEVDPGKNYYAKVVNGSEVSYELISSPSGNPSEQGYYDVTDGYFFEIGYDLPEDDTDEKRVYEYSGKVPTGDTSTVLNLSYLKPLIPIGKAGQPFVASIKGNGISIENFTVQGTGFSDIGIFGYVGDQKDRSGTLDGVFFDNFTIDITGCDSSMATSEEHDQYNGGVGAHSANTCNIGYLAGHIANTGTFTDVYVNNCELKGVSGNNIGKNVYGYYGKADKDVEHGEEGKGFSYKFTFDSKAFYNYINGNWQTGDNLSTGYIRSRNTSYDDFYRDNKDNSKRIANNALTRGNSLIQGRNYALTGTNPGAAQAARNFSTSTLGFYNEGSVTETFEYDVKYTEVEDSETKLMMDEDSLLDNSFTPATQPNGSATGQGYYYFAPTDSNGNGYWKYYKSYNYADPTSYNLTYKMDTLPSDRISGWGGGYNYADVTNAAATLSLKVYIDDQEYTSQNYSITVSITSTTILNLYSWTTLSFTIPKNTVSLTIPNVQRGTHNVGVTAQVTSAALNGDTIYYRDSNLTANNNNLTLKTQNVQSNATTTVSKFTAGNKNAWQVNGAPFTGYIIKNYKNNQDGPAYDGPYFLYGDDLSTEEISWQKLDLLRSEFRTQSEDIVDEGGNTIHKYEWICVSTWIHDVSDDSIHWLGDQPNIVDSGYNSKNIDIIGGGVSFSQNYCTLVAENFSLTNMSCRAVPNNKVYDGKTQTTKYKFYATDYCSNSVVMYIKNMNDSNGTMGEVTFNYTLAIAQYINVTLKEPSFKKGYDADRVAAGNYQAANCFVDFTTFGDNYVNETDGDDRKATITIKRDDINRASFCGLDVDGNIVAKFNELGDLICGDSSLIDTYVLALGVHKSNGQTNININTRITSIDFYFKAEGYGGTFGTVDYRSKGQGPEVEKSILTYIFQTCDTPAADQTPTSTANFSIKVSYSEEEVGEEETSQYQGKYDITAVLTEGNSITITFYLYDVQNYYLVINGEEFKGLSSYTLELTT